MKRVMKGLHEGTRVRVEKVGSGWETEVKLRDCGEILGINTGYFEGSDDGRWTRIGSFPTLVKANLAAELLFAGTYVFKAPYRNEAGQVPGLLVAFADASDEIAARTAPRP